MTIFDELTAEPAVLSDLHEALVADAEAAGLVDVGYRTLDSPIGPLLVAATGEGVVRVAFAAEDHDAVLASLADRVSPRILLDRRRLDGAARELDEYFAGSRTAFDLRLDLRLAHGFRRTVLEQLRRIGYGSTASYRSVAVASGSAGAVRAVGTTCATNPIPVIVPCHRVVRSDGTMGQYRGGPAAKKVLLDLEAAHAPQ